MPTNDSFADAIRDVIEGRWRCTPLGARHAQSASYRPAPTQPWKLEYGHACGHADHFAGQWPPYGAAARCGDRTVGPSRDALSADRLTAIQPSAQ